MRNIAKTLPHSILFISLLILASLAQVAMARPMDASKTNSQAPNRDDCVDRAEVDPVYYGGGGGHALWLPGIGTDFIFDFRPGRFWQMNGMGSIVGRAHRISNPAEAFDVYIEVGGYTTTAPAGSPKKELRSSAYVDNGGPVDPSTWVYYTEFHGTLTGVKDYDGAVIEVSRRGPAFQVGLGASGKNIQFGGSSWIDWSVISQPFSGELQVTGHGDFNLNLGRCHAVCVQRADADLDYLAANVGGSAFQLIGISRDFVFTENTYFVEYENGTAKLRGYLHKESFPNHRFEVKLQFSQHSSTPPSAASPKLELPAMAYTGNGGPIDPSAWRYYAQVSGTLTGMGFFEGAELELQSYGPAYQVGYGASGKNTLHGGSGWIGYTVVQQPNNSYLPSSGDGDMSVTDCPTNLQVPSMSGCGASEVMAYKPGYTGMTNTPMADRRDATAALGLPEDTDRLNFVSLGYGGALMLKMSTPIMNGPGADLQVYNTTFAGKSCDEYPEHARVSVSKTGARWLPVGTICQDGGALDLGVLDQAEYVLIEDVSNHHDFFDGEASDGFDVDGVVSLHCGQ